MARTFPKVPGTNFDHRDYTQSAPGYVFRPMSAQFGAKVGEDAIAWRDAAEDKRREKAFRLHLGSVRVEVAPSPVFGGGYAPTDRTFVSDALTPRDLTDDELTALSAQLNAQVKDTDAAAYAAADEAKIDFERRKAENIAALEKVMEAITSQDERLGLGLRAAIIDVRQKLEAQRSITFDRGEVLRPNLATDSLKLAASEVSRELKNRRAAQAAEQAKLREMLQQAGIGL